MPSRAACRAAGFDAGNVKLETLAAQILDHVRPAARRYLGAYDGDEEAAHDALERAAHDLEVLASSDPLAAGIQRYRDLQLAAPSASADADSDRLLAQNRRVEPAWDSDEVRAGSGAAVFEEGARCTEGDAAVEIARFIGWAARRLPVIEGALFFPPSIEMI